MKNKEINIIIREGNDICPACLDYFKNVHSKKAIDSECERCSVGQKWLEFENVNEEKRMRNVKIGKFCIEGDCKYILNSIREGYTLKDIDKNYPDSCLSCKRMQLAKIYVSEGNIWYVYDYVEKEKNLKIFEMVTQK